MLRFAGWCVAFSASLAPARVARADEPTDELKNRCADAYEATQRQRSSGALLEARKSALFCAQSACPALLRNDCAPWAGELASKIPALIVEARSRNGEAPRAVSVELDGAIGEPLDGRAHELNPGRHELTISAAGWQTQRVEVVLVEGNRAQRVVVVLEPVPSSPPRQRRAIPAVSYALAGVGVVALSSFAYFGLSGSAKQRELDACRPGCDSSLRAPLERDYLVADISLGVGLVALGLSAWTAIASQSAPPPEAKLDVDVTRQGAFVSYRRGF